MKRKGARSPTELDMKPASARIVSLILLLFSGVGVAADLPLTRPSGAASDPLAIVRFTDFRIASIQLADKNDREVLSIEGAYIFHPTFKVNYDANYWHTDVTGSDQTGLADIRIRPIYFPRTQRWRGFLFRTAIGMDLRLDGGNVDKGIGDGAHQLGVLAGLQLLFSRQSRISIVGEYRNSFHSDTDRDLEQTLLGLVGIHTFPSLKSWVAADLLFLVNHQDDHASTTTLKMQVGRSFTESTGAHLEALFPLAGQELFDYAIRLTLRVQY